MSSTYLDKYTIVQIFKENAYQKVYVGTDNKNDQAVVINCIDLGEDDLFWTSLEYSYKDIFKHILHFEKTGDQVILVTKVEDGVSLNTYLNDFSPSFKERASLIYQYLKEINRYRNLPNNIQALLVSESQITVNEGRISFDELIIFDESSYCSNSFQSVLNNVVSLLKKLTSLPSVTYEELHCILKLWAS